MNNAQVYWAKVKKVRDGLAREVFITSIGPMDREEALAFGQMLGGVTCGAFAANAARRIVEGTHRLATEKEIEKFHADQRERDKLCAATEAARRKEAIRVLPGELAKALNLT